MICNYMQCRLGLKAYTIGKKLSCRMCELRQSARPKTFGHWRKTPKIRLVQIADRDFITLLEMPLDGFGRTEEPFAQRSVAFAVIKPPPGRPRHIWGTDFTRKSRADLAGCRRLLGSRNFNPRPISFTSNAQVYLQRKTILLRF
jgi:hypothetical protein